MGIRKIKSFREKGSIQGYALGWEHGYRDGLQAGMEKAKTVTKPVSASKPKIVYVIPGCAISGGIAVILQHANRLLARGYPVVLVTADNQRKIVWHPNQVEIVPLSEAPANPDIAVATQWSTVDPARNLRAKRNYYFVQSDETKFYAENDENHKLALQTYRSDDFQFLTMARWLERWLQETFQKSAIYIPNGLDETLIYQAAPTAPKEGKIRVLLEGAIDNPLKGMKEAFAAVRDLDCEVWCVSSQGEPMPDWRCDRFFNSVPYEQMKHIYSSCDILLKMSKVESFLYPPLEMMACGGVPVVAEVAGTDEYLRHDYNAWIVPQSVDAAREAVARLIEDDLLRQRLIEGGRETARNWKWDRSIDLLEGVFA